MVKELSPLEKALLPYEKKLIAQEKLRRQLSVKQVDQPTYQRYITGSVEQFDLRKNAFALLQPDNPFGAEFLERIKKRTGYDSQSPLPYSELEEEDRIAQSIAQAAWRLCNEYHPKPLPVTPKEGRVEVTDIAKMARLVKKVTLFFGADLVGITRIDPRWIYKGVQISHRYAILAVVSHRPGFLSTAPSHLSAAASRDTYSRLKFITTQLADFICGLGYDAMYRETRGNADAEMLMVPMAIDAGIGEFARNGRVLSPEFGTNMRIKAVTTDLPLEIDKPISFGVHDFCMNCENCAAFCPANAIPFGEPTDTPINIYNNPGYRKWYVNAERCLNFFLSNKKKWTSCGGRCMHVCPWNNPLVPWHNVVRYFAINSPSWGKKFLVKADKIYHKRSKKINRG